MLQYDTRKQRLARLTAQTTVLQFAATQAVYTDYGSHAQGLCMQCKHETQGRAMCTSSSGGAHNAGPLHRAFMLHVAWVDKCPRQNKKCACSTTRQLHGFNTKDARHTSSHNTQAATHTQARAHFERQAHSHMHSHMQQPLHTPRVTDYQPREWKHIKGVKHTSMGA